MASVVQTSFARFLQDSKYLLDYNKDGNIVWVEILNALIRMENPRALEYVSP